MRKIGFYLFSHLIFFPRLKTAFKNFEIVDIKSLPILQFCSLSEGRLILHKWRLILDFLDSEVHNSYMYFRFAND